MQRAVEVIEPLREQALSSYDAYELGMEFDAAVAQVVGDSVVPVIRQLREGYFAAMAGRVADLLIAPDYDGHADSDWIRAFAEAVGEYRNNACEELLRGETFPGIDHELRSGAQRIADRVRDEEWADLRVDLEWLLEHAILEDAERAPLLAMASLIELFILGDQAAARQLADAALRAGPADPRAAEALSYCLHYEDRRADAEAVLREVLVREPTSGVAQVALGRIARENGDLADAEQLLLTGIRGAPGLGELYRELITLYTEPTLFPEREARLPLLAAQARALDPESAYSIDVDLGCTYRDNDAADRALETLTRAVETEPDRPRGRVELARLYLAKNDLAAARSELDTVLRIDPTYVDTATVYADLSQRAGRPDEAISWNQRELALTRGNPGQVLARLAARLHDSERVEDGWRTACDAVKAAPNDWRLLEVLEEVVNARWVTNPQDVRTLYATFLQLGEDAPTAIYSNLIGNTAYLASDLEVARAEFSSAVEIDPSTPAYHRNLGRVLRDLGRWEDALAAIDAAYAIDRDDAVRRYERAWIINGRGNEAYGVGDSSRAAAEYQNAIDDSPDQAVLYGNLALALLENMPEGEHQQRLEHAVDALTHATALDSESDYEVGLARVQGRLDRVRRFSELIDVSTDLPAIIVEFADDLVPRVDAAQEGGSVIPQQIPAMRARLESDIGFMIPGLLLRAGDLHPGEYRVLFFGVPRAVGRASARRVCLLADLDSLVDRGLSRDDGLEITDPVTGRSQTWVEESVIPALALEGVEQLNDVDAILRHVEQLIRADSGLFFGLDAASSWLGAEGHAPASTSHIATGRAALGRRIAGSRTLRACARDGIQLDDQVRAVVDDLVSEVRDVGVRAEAAVRQIRRTLSDRLPRWHLVEMPSWAEEILLGGRRLTRMEEHKLMQMLEPIVDVHPHVTVVTAAEDARAYAQRLLLDHFDRVVGARVNVLSRDEASMADSRQPLVGGTGA
ncbi:tetratricopeptide repeat protein [Kribbella sp. VKM Ac-2569]|uniref:tetratricopeptide repeat protein n=1 Tax=Kribbella sp. VKM Ac-2569 TaxID=2512220 RepID=UPI0010EB31FB|nr:tetratricopeptide repeat protein [Kribbella sp. VKM Ac-2569]RZT17544.1 tetratricopeptide repeat protein [Kribbella sp. VKM Ac-2569]